MSTDEKLQPDSDRAWNDDDVIADLGIEQRQLRTLLSSASFPKPQHLDGLRDARRWAPDAIPSWVEAPERTRRSKAARIGVRGTAEKV